MRLNEYGPRIFCQLQDGKITKGFVIGAETSFHDLYFNDYKRIQVDMHGTFICTINPLGLISRCDLNVKSNSFYDLVIPHIILLLNKIIADDLDSAIVKAKCKSLIKYYAIK